MGHYKSNLRDIEFNLFEVFGTGEMLGQRAVRRPRRGRPSRAMLAQVAELAEGPIGESFADADRNPPVFDPATNSVTMPESFKKSWKALIDAEFWRLERCPELGGHRGPARAVLGDRRAGARRATRRLHMYVGRRAVRRRPLPPRHRRAEAPGRS